MWLARKELETRKKLQFNCWNEVFHDDIQLDDILGTHLFVKVPRPGDSEGTISVFELTATCYYQSNHSKV